jgi:hypothetical protein
MPYVRVVALIIARCRTCKSLSDNSAAITGLQRQHGPGTTPSWQQRARGWLSTIRCRNRRGRKNDAHGQFTRNRNNKNETRTRPDKTYHPDGRARTDNATTWHFVRPSVVRPRGGTRTKRTRPPKWAGVSGVSGVLVNFYCAEDR